MGIKAFLLVFLFTAFLLYWKIFQNRLINRLLLLGALSLAVILIVWPDLSTRVANWLGVGRGTDLLLYLSIVTVLFVLLMMYAKIKKLEETITSLIRDKAIHETNKSQ